MNLTNRHTSVFLMVMSLVLLAVFLGLFLKKSWADEVSQLQKETGYLFVNSVRGIEGDMLDRILLKGIGGKADSIRKSLVDFSVELDSLTDSLEVVTFVGKKEKTELPSEQEVRMEVRKIKKKESVSNVEGALSVIVAMEEDHIWMDSSTHAHLDRKFELMPRLKSNFDTQMLLASLPVDYRIVNLSSDSVIWSGVMSEGTYYDMATGDKYGVELNGYEAFVFQKLWPQFLFAIGLFACVSLAFWAVFKTLEAQRHLTELKNDFIQNVTHELKTPIATVGVAIEAMQDFDALKNPAKTQEYLDISKNELGRLSLLVDKVLRMSLFEKKEPELKMESFDFRRLIQEILASMRLQFEKCQAEVSTEFIGSDFYLNGDRIHLSSVIYNLLDNGLKYSDGAPVLNLHIKKNKESVTLKISDHGRGIAPEYREKVFEKFFRVPSGQIHEVKGHGLGLSYVASVVKKHGGTIEVESRANEGTTFTVQLPA